MKKAISRRDFLKVVGVSAAALGMTACGGSSASTSTAASSTAASSAAASAAGAGEGGSGNDFTLTWNEVNGEDYGATVGAHTFAEKIEELSGGHIKIDLYINGTLGSEAESMQGIQMGTLDIFRGNASSLPNYGAELIGTTGLPYVFKDMAQFEDVAESSLGDELLQSVEDANCGYVALGWLVEGPRSMFITPKVYERLGKPTEFTLDLMKGLKVRVPETDLMISTMDALGASATAIAYSELYTSLQSGVVDAAENGVTSYMSNSFNEVAPYFITDAHTFGCGVILMNADKWNGLIQPFSASTTPRRAGSRKLLWQPAQPAMSTTRSRSRHASIPSATRASPCWKLPTSRSGRRPAHLCMQSRAPMRRISSQRSRAATTKLRQTVLTDQ